MVYRGVTHGHHVDNILISITIHMHTHTDIYSYHHMKMDIVSKILDL